MVREPRDSPLPPGEDVLVIGTEAIPFRMMPLSAAPPHRHSGAIRRITLATLLLFSVSALAMAFLEGHLGWVATYFLISTVIVAVWVGSALRSRR
jgi:hypothetical protein